MSFQEQFPSVPIIHSAYYNQSTFPNSYTNNHLVPYPNYPAWSDPHHFPGTMPQSSVFDTVPTIHRQATYPEIALGHYDIPQTTSYRVRWRYPTSSPPSIVTRPSSIPSTSSAAPTQQQQVASVTVSNTTKKRSARVEDTRQTKKPRVEPWPETTFVMEELPVVRNEHNSYPTSSPPSIVTRPSSTPFTSSVAPTQQQQVASVTAPNITKKRSARVEDTHQTKKPRVEPWPKTIFIMEKLPVVTPGTRTQIIKIWPEPQGRKSHISRDVVPVSAIYAPAIFHEREIPKKSRWIFVTITRAVCGLLVDAQFKDKVEELMRGYDANKEAFGRKLRSLPSPWYDKREPLIHLRCPSAVEEPKHAICSVSASESVSTHDDLKERALKKNVVNFSSLNKAVCPGRAADCYWFAAALTHELD